MKSKDLTNGSIVKGLVIFTLPLMLGNLFQQLYNTVDSIVVGNYVGKAALAAVGAGAALINALIGFFMGMSAGGSVAISQYFGAKDDVNLQKAVQSFFTITLILGVAFTFIGVAVSPAVLRAINIPDDVMPAAVTYLRIYFYGVIGLMLYNMGSAVLRAVGDSKRPLLFLCFSALTNVVLDLVFVIYFKMGVAGVAWATLISQALSAILVMAVLLTTKEKFRLVLKDMRWHDGMTRKILMIGLPVGVQQSITSISNIIVQSYINAFGSAVMAGYTACSKIEVFIMLPMQSMSLAITTFVGQNVGARKYLRAHEGTKKGLLISLAVVVPLCVLTVLMGRTLLNLFTAEADVIESGFMFIKVFVPFYWTMSIIQGLAGALRGHGDANAPMLIMLCSFVGLRQLMLTIASDTFRSLSFVAYSFPITWLVCAAAMMIYYFRKSKTFDKAEAMENDYNAKVFSWRRGQKQSDTDHR